MAEAPHPPGTRNHLGQLLGPPLPDWRPPQLPVPLRQQGQHCVLEPLTAHHAHDLFTALAEDRDGRLWTYLGYGPFRDCDAYRRWLDTVGGRTDPCFLAILDARGDHAQGVASWMRIMPEHGSIEIGHLAFAPRLQRTTAATDALSMMITTSFAMGYRRCEWKCHAFNRESRRAAVRLGFSYEGTFRNATVVKGHSRDTAWYAITDRDWASIRQAHAQWLSPANFDLQGRQRSRLGELVSALHARPPEALVID